MISGIDAADLQTSDQEYTVKVMYPEDRFQDVSDLSGLMIPTRSRAGRCRITGRGRDRL